jgi:hypothetical protein
MSAPFASTGFRIITADERLAERRGIKGVLTGISGIGKTSQLWTLDAGRTLFLNLEAGELAVQGWPGDEVRIRDWELARDLACWVGGPNPAMRADQTFSAAHYERVCSTFGDPASLAKYDTLFVDSITVASRLCLQWCKGQPQATSDRSGKPDMRGAYGWLVGILDKRLDDFNRPYFTLQIEGAKTGLELPGIVDEVVTMAELKTEDGKPYRAFICQTLNPFGYPAKDRSGRLDAIEEPHLGRLMEKIRRPLGDPPPARLEFGRPAAADAISNPTPNSTDAIKGA